MALNTGKCSQCQADNAYSRTECHVCGARLPWANAVTASRDGNYAATASRDESSVLLFILGLFCWPAGVIVWALQRDQYPRRSASALNGAIASFVVGLVLFGVIFLMSLSSRRTTTVYTSAYNTVVGPSSGVPYRPFVQLTKKPTNAPPTSTPKPTPTPTYFFKRINLKMSYEEVVKAVGRKEDRKQVKPDFTTYIWKQRASDGDTVNAGSTLEVTFNEGSISNILQH